jgi:hypothetical protein
LSFIKRWWEVAGFCERLAACNALQGSIFINEVEDFYPFPGVPPAVYLKVDFFKNTRDEDTTPATWSKGVPVEWRGRERDKLAFTKSRREEADELFRSREFELASQKFVECLVIDRDGNGGHDPLDGLMREDGCLPFCT